jgi:hypothetical protein
MIKLHERPLLNPRHDIIRLGAEDIDLRNLVAFLIRADRIMQRQVLARLLQRPQMHKYFLFDTASRERRELRAFTNLKALYGFN